MLILGDGLALRPMSPAHAETLFQLVEENRAFLRRWLPWLDWNTSVADSQKFIEGTLQRSAEKSGYTFGIWHRDELAGVIDYHRLDYSNRIGSIGYWLGENHQGRGLMTQSCRAMIDSAFTTLNLNRLEIRCAVENAKSRAIPERLGFTHEGTLRQSEWLYDHFVDHALYGLLRAEWQNLKP